MPNPGEPEDESAWKLCNYDTCRAPLMWRVATETKLPKESYSLFLVVEHLVGAFIFGFGGLMWKSPALYGYGALFDKDVLQQDWIDAEMQSTYFWNPYVLLFFSGVFYHPSFVMRAFALEGVCQIVRNIHVYRIAANGELFFESAVYGWGSRKYKPEFQFYLRGGYFACSYTVPAMLCIFLLPADFPNTESSAGLYGRVGCSYCVRLRWIRCVVISAAISIFLISLWYWLKVKVFAVFADPQFSSVPTMIMFGYKKLVIVCQLGAPQDRPTKLFEFTWCAELAFGILGNFMANAVMESSSTVDLGVFLMFDWAAFLLRNGMYFGWGSRIIGARLFEKVQTSFRSTLPLPPERMSRHFGTFRASRISFGAILLAEGVLTSRMYLSSTLLLLESTSFNFVCANEYKYRYLPLRAVTYAYLFFVFVSDHAQDFTTYRLLRKFSNCSFFPMLMPSHLYELRRERFEFFFTRICLAYSVNYAWLWEYTLNAGLWFSEPPQE